MDTGDCFWVIFYINEEFGKIIVSVKIEEIFSLQIIIFEYYKNVKMMYMLFLGYTLIQIPGLLMVMFDYIKQDIYNRVFPNKLREQTSRDILSSPRVVAVENDETGDQVEVTKMWQEITKRLEKIEKHIELKNNV